LEIDSGRGVRGDEPRWASGSGGGLEKNRRRQGGTCSAVGGANRVAELGKRAGESLYAQFARSHFLTKKRGDAFLELAQRRTGEPFEGDDGQGAVLGGGARRHNADLELLADLGDL